MSNNTNDKLALIHSNLQKLIKDKAKAMPKGFNDTRFLQNCMTVLQDTKDIEKMEPLSVARTMLKGAFLGLDFFNRECYAIPYGDKLQFQTDYKGETKLAKKYSINEVEDIYAKLVREGDKFEETIVNGQQSVNFTPKPFNDKPIIGVFAVCLYKNGRIAYETLTPDEVNTIRDIYSKMPNGKAWGKSWGEMAKKTAIRRLCKMIEIEFDTFEQQEAYQGALDAEFVVSDEKDPVKMPEEIKQDQPPKDNGNNEKIGARELKEIKDALDGLDPDMRKEAMTEMPYLKKLSTDLTMEQYRAFKNWVSVTLAKMFEEENASEEG